MTPLRVLICEDNDDDVTLVLRTLGAGGYDVVHGRVQTARDMQAALGRGPWDIVLSDFSMPEFSALDALHVLHASGLDLPFIIVSGTIGEDAAVEALKAGAHDFLTKQKLARLVPAIVRELREAEGRGRRRAAELELERSERLLRSVLDSVPDGVTACDTQGRLTIWNSGATRILRTGPTERPPSEWPETFGLLRADGVTPHPSAELPLVRAMRGESVDRHELCVRNADLPSGIWLSVNARPLRDSTGKVVGGVMAFCDITEERAAQQQLMISDRMASVGMLAAGVAHEINNPLAAVVGNLDLALREVETLKHADDPSPSILVLDEELRDAREAGDQVRQIVRDLKIFSRGSEERTGPVDVRRVMESTLRMAWNEIRHRARLVKDYGDVPPVEASESRLGQVFLNLVVNAAQAMPEGRAEAHEIRIATSAREQRVIVEIADTGPGIPPEVMRRLFTPFVTTKPVGVGTGLGLSICHRIVTGFGGVIDVESAPGRGTCFRIALPVATSLEPPERPVFRASHRAPGHGRVLIVDDEPMIARLVGRTLGDEHEVSSEQSAQAALTRLLAGERFDVILCDVMMPTMSGMDLHAALARSVPEAAERMVFLTGGAFTPQAREFLDAVSNLRLDKPFEPAALRAIVRERIE